MPRIEVVIKHTADTMEQKGSKELFVQVMEIRRECFGQATVRLALGHEGLEGAS